MTSAISSASAVVCSSFKPRGKHLISTSGICRLPVVSQGSTLSDNTVGLQHLVQFRQLTYGVRNSRKPRRIGCKPVMAWPPGARHRDIHIQQRQPFTQRKRGDLEL